MKGFVFYLGGGFVCLFVFVVGTFLFAFGLGFFFKLSFNLEFRWPNSSSSTETYTRTLRSGSGSKGLVVPFKSMGSTSLATETEAQAGLVYPKGSGWEISSCKRNHLSRRWERSRVRYLDAIWIAGIPAVIPTVVVFLMLLFLCSMPQVKSFPLYVYSN